MNPVRNYKINGLMMLIIAMQKRYQISNGVKTINIFLVTTLFLFLTIEQVQAAGLVPCGGTGESACSFCDFFVMVDNFIDFILIKFVPVVAVLMLVVGGIYFFFGGASPSALETGKKIITSTIWGLVIVFAAFLIVGTILSALGLTGWTEDLYKNWWSEGFFQIPGC